MRRVLIGAMVLFMGIMAPRLASAQAKQGDKEILINGDLSLINFSSGGFSSTTTNGNGVFNVGQYFSDTLEIGGGPSVNITAGGGGGTTTTVGGNAFLRKYLHSKRPTVAPFLGLGVSVQDFSDISNNLFTVAQFGIKDYISERAAFELTSSFGLNPSHPGEFQILEIRAGLTVLFGGK